MQIYIYNLTDSYLDILGKARRRSSVRIILENAPPKKSVQFKVIELDNNNEKNNNHRRLHKNKNDNDINIVHFNTQGKKKHNTEKNNKTAIKNSKAALINSKKKISSNDLFLNKPGIKTNTNIKPDKIDKKEKLEKPDLDIKKPEPQTNPNGDPDNKSMDKAFNIDPKDAHFFKEYLSTDLIDLEYDDAIHKDKRKFGKCFYEILKERQMIAYTFIAEDPLKTRCTKIMLLSLNIIFYFVVNGLFFSEDYISDIYNSTKEEKFFSFFPRSIKRFLYCTIVSIIISYITDMFFIEEKKIVGIFKREKDNKIILKQEITQLIKNLKCRYLSFIITVFVILLFAFFYLLCFNYVYPHTQIEWIKSSFIIFIIMQILSILSCLLEATLRIGSFKCKSEKMYKISKLLG